MGDFLKLVRASLPKITAIKCRAVFSCYEYQNFVGSFRELGDIIAHWEDETWVCVPKLNSCNETGKAWAPYENVHG